MSGNESRQKPTSLAAVRRLTDEIGRSNRDRTGLASIHGGGASRSPELALVFMNPTRRNLSSRAGWRGPRFPFIGTPRIWRMLVDCQLLDRRLAEKFAKPAGVWSTDDARQLEQQLVRASLYITNVVKETAVDSLMPKPAVFRQYETLLHDEIELVKPRLIVAFGLAAHKSLTGMSIRLAEIYEQALRVGRVTLVGSCRGRPVIPCYFPVGRGNPQRAATILWMIAEGRTDRQPGSRRLKPKQP